MTFITIYAAPIHPKKELMSYYLIGETYFLKILVSANKVANLYLIISLQRELYVIVKSK